MLSRLRAMSLKKNFKGFPKLFISTDQYVSVTVSAPNPIFF